MGRKVGASLVLFVYLICGVSGIVSANEAVEVNEVNEVNEVMEWETRYGIGLDKEWEIVLTREVSEEDLGGKIKVTLEGEELDLVIRKEGKKLYIKTKEPLRKNTEYELVILGDLKSEGGEFLEEGISMRFITGEDRLDEKHLEDYIFLNEYGNKVEVDWYGEVLFRDIRDRGRFGYTVSKRFKDFGIGVGSEKFEVLKELGKPLDYIYKGDSGYSVEGEDEYVVYDINGKYVTFFFDKDNAGKVRAIHWVSKEVEDREEDFYLLRDRELLRDQEDLMVILMNKDRELAGLRPLEYSSEVSEVARLHSSDMIESDFFGHENKDGEDPQDRLHRAGLTFVRVGENLAYGQRSIFYAHEGLLSSKEHKETLLKDYFKEVGVGIVIDGEGVPYYTVKFLTR